MRPDKIRTSGPEPKRASPVPEHPLSTFTAPCVILQNLQSATGLTMKLNMNSEFSKPFDPKIRGPWLPRPKSRLILSAKLPDLPNLRTQVPPVRYQIGNGHLRVWGKQTHYNIRIILRMSASIHLLVETGTPSGLILMMKFNLISSVSTCCFFRIQV